MLNLLLAMSCSAAIALLFKFSESRQYPRLVVTVFNYLVGVSISISLLAINPVRLFAFDLSGFVTELTRVFNGERVSFSASGSIIWSVGLGIVTGVLFLTNFIYYQKSVKHNGAGLSGTFQKMGIAIPVVIAIFVFREYPTALQWLGIALSVGVIVYLNGDSQQKVRRVYLLLTLFLMGGFSEFSNKLFQQYALDDYRALFLCVVFATAFVISAVMMIKERLQLALMPCLIGAAVGMVNYGSSYFLIQSLSSVPATLAFPTFSIGSLTIIIVFSHLLYREAMSKRERVALAIAAGALLLMNV